MWIKEYLRRALAVPVVGLIGLIFFNPVAIASATPEEDHWHMLCEKGDQAEIGHDYQKAEGFFKDALAAARPFGPKSKQMQTSLARMGTILVLEGQFDQADQYFVQCMSLLTEMNKKGESDPDALVWLDDFGDAYQEMGKKVPARTTFCLEHCVALREAIAPGKHSKLASVCEQLANIYLKNQKYDQAEKLLDIQIQCIYSKYGPKALVFSPLSNLAVVQEKQGKFAQAESNMTKAIALMNLNGIQPIYIEQCRKQLSRIQSESKAQRESPANGNATGHAAAKPAQKK